MAAHERPGAAAAARLRGPGAGALSARLERFLQLCAEDNIQVVNLTTPAQYFHALRRQMHRAVPQAAGRDDAQEPAAPQACVSSLAEFGAGQPVPARARRDRPARRAGRDVRRVVLCSGQGLLRAAGRARAEREHRRRRASCASSSSTRSRRASWPSGSRAIPKRARSSGAGGAGEHGRLALRRPPHRAALSRARRCGQARRATSAGDGGDAGDRARRSMHVHEQADLSRRARCDAARIAARSGEGDRAMAVEVKVPALGESITEATVAVAQARTATRSRSTSRCSSSRPTRRPSRSLRRPPACSPRSRVARRRDGAGRRRGRADRGGAAPAAAAAEARTPRRRRRRKRRRCRDRSARAGPGDRTGSRPRRPCADCRGRRARPCASWSRSTRLDAGGDRSRTGKDGRADQGRRAGGARPVDRPRAASAARRRRPAAPRRPARRAPTREERVRMTPAAPAHRRAPRRGAAHRGDPHHLQRGRHDAR